MEQNCKSIEVTSKIFIALKRVIKISIALRELALVNRLFYKIIIYFSFIFLKLNRYNFDQLLSKMLTRIVKWSF